MTSKLQSILEFGQIIALVKELKQEPPKRLEVTNWKEYLFSGEVNKKKLTNLFK